MRIDPNQGAQGLPESSLTSQSASSAVAAQTTAAGGPGEDQAQLSGAHVQIQALVAQALQFPEVRQEKVNALRQVVLEGNYHPSASDVANSVFSHLLVAKAA
jgi:flagellar biosynthesis anti-sigma factor FlgM